jgi:uncharacterized cupredoxin-like copper-binding protein
MESGIESQLPDYLRRACRAYARRHENPSKMRKPMIDIFSKTILAAAVPVMLLTSAATAMAHGEGDGEHAYSATSTPFGDYEPGFQAERVIEVRMNDGMRFEPSTIEVRAGEVIRFEVINEGQQMHEMVLGTSESLAEHAELMKRFPNMEHDEPYMAHVEPGQTRRILWRFGESGSVAFGCLIPGHFDAGMKGVVNVQ